MQSRDTRAFQALRRVDNWTDAHPTLVPVEVQPQIANLKSVTAAVTAASAAQDEGRRKESAASVSVRGIRVELRQHHLIPLAKVARQVLTETPELAAALHVPMAKASNETLITAAQAMATIGGENEQLFIQHGLATTFVADLEQQAAALKQAIDSRGQIRSSVVGATQGLKSQLLAGRKTVHSLDVTLSRVLRNDPSELASWKNAKRVTIKGVQPKVGVSTPAGTPGTTPVIPITPVVSTSTHSATAATAAGTGGTAAA
ncbi:MAG TPA: hypothetical protein VII52_04980 [Gemmatimonadaceae bacterium]